MSNLTKSMFQNSVAALGEDPRMDINTEAALNEDGQAPETVEPKLDVERLTRAFVHMRDARLALKSEFEKKDRAIRSKQAVIEAAMLDFLNTHNLKTAPTESGTFYKQEEITPTGADWGALYQWIKENDAFDALERRIKKTFISEYMEENEGGLPPGVSVFREFKVRVRRK